MTFSILKLTLPAAAIGFVAIASPAAANQLTGQQFVDIHAGKCLSYTGPSVGTECYNTDGTTAYEDESYGNDNGTWIMQGDNVCVRYTQEPALDCGPVSSVGGGAYTDGEYTWTIN